VTDNPKTWREARRRTGYRSEEFTSHAGNDPDTNATEGVGLYVAHSRAMAGMFGGSVRKITYREPKNPLIVDEEPLYLLYQFEGMQLPEDLKILPGDSLWTRFNKQAALNCQVSDIDPPPKGTWPAGDLARELTRLIKAEGYDAVRVTSGGDTWDVLFHPEISRERTESVESTGLCPEIFGPDSKMLPDVLRGLQAMADDLIADLLEKGYAVMPEAIYLTGSLAGRNWDAESDLDLHFVIDVARFPDPDLVKRYLALYARTWNGQGYELAGHPVEAYFQDVREPHTSPGVYDIRGDMWLKSPDAAVATSGSVGLAAAALAARVIHLERKYQRVSKGGAKDFLAVCLAQWHFVRLMRKEALTGPDGYQGFGNQVFKALRRNGAIQRLLDLVHQVKQDLYIGQGDGDGQTNQ